VIRGVPRLLTGSLRDAAIRDLRRDHPDLVQELEPEEPPPARPDRLDELKRSTIERFGFEWTEYARFGWDDPVYDAQRERAVFLRKSLLGEEDLGGKLVLDAGSGNGRYSYWAARLGGRVFAVDLGDGVDAAAANTRDQNAIQVVQADIFALPFEVGTFDVIFSIGVLMHTGDARRAVESLAGALAPGGSLSVHLYGRGNAMYEAVDRALRARTTKRSIPELLRFTGRLYRLRRWLDTSAWPASSAGSSGSTLTHTASSTGTPPPSPPTIRTRRSSGGSARWASGSSPRTNLRLPQDFAGPSAPWLERRQP